MAVLVANSQPITVHAVEYSSPTIVKPNLNLPCVIKPTALEQVLGYTSFAFAGLSNAYNQVWVAEPSVFGNGTGFWETNSWKRKYADFDNGDLSSAFPGSKSVLIGFTDGFHATNVGRNLGISTGTLLLDGNDKRKWLRFASGWVIYGLTSHFSYNKIRFGSFKS